MYWFWSRVLGNRAILWKLCSRYYAKKENGVWSSPTLRKIYEKKKQVVVGECSYGWDTMDIKGPLEIGKYVSIGPGVKRFEVNHDVTAVTTSPFIFNPICGWVDKDYREKQKLVIGNDVWIGANVVICPSCHRIGNGSVIAAGAVVTQDVPPYSIVGGVPAKVIKKRFSDDVCEALESTCWWDINKEQIKDLLLKYKAPEDFIEAIKEIKNK